MKNLKEFKELIGRYESISIEEIESIWDVTYLSPAQRLTGFGKPETCKLCLAVFSFCNECVWGPNDIGCIDHDTYDAIAYARTPNDLLTAYRNRAAYMRKYLSEKGIS